MSHSSKQWSGRLLAEFLIVFLSIVLAFIAEDWRTSRNDASDEREILTMMLEDLREDREDMLRWRSELLEFQAHGAQLFDAIKNCNAPPDTLALLMRRATHSWSYQPSYPTYISLTRSGNLGLIRDNELRNRVIFIYENSYKYLQSLNGHNRERAMNAQNRLNRYIWRVHYNGTWGNYRLVSSPEEFCSDKETLGFISTYSASCNFIAQRIENLFVPRNDTLMMEIETYLSQ